MLWVGWGPRHATISPLAMLHKSACRRLAPLLPIGQAPAVVPGTGGAHILPQQQLAAAPAQQGVRT